MVHEFIGLRLADACVFEELAVAVFIGKGALYVFKDHLVALIYFQLRLIQLLFMLFAYFSAGRRLVSFGVEGGQSKPVNVLVLLRPLLYVLSQLLEVFLVRFAAASTRR